LILLKACLGFTLKKNLDVHRIIDGKVQEMTTAKALAYVDVQRLDEGTIEPDYVVWVNKATSHGLKDGVPEEYFGKYLRWVGDEGKEQDIMMVRTRKGKWGGVQGRVMGGLDRG
jgi:gamma-glutamylcyclotransferase